MNNNGIKLVMTGILVSSVALLSGCAGQKQNLKAPNVMHHSIDLQIDAAAQSAARSLSQLALIKKQQNPSASKMPFANVSSAQLSTYLSLNWYGPMEPAVRNIAHTIGYKLQVYGKKPSVPVLVNINTTGNVETAKQILTNIELQAGNSAGMAIFPQQRLITVRYFNHAPAV